MPTVLCRLEDGLETICPIAIKDAVEIRQSILGVIFRNQRSDRERVDR